MSNRRRLGEMLSEVVSGSMDALSAAPELRVSQISLTLPVEVQLSWIGRQVELLGDLPRLITRTDFDVKPSRVEVIWEAKKLP